MAAISPRKRADGTISYTDQIRIKKDGAQVYTESQTFARKKAAEASHFLSTASVILKHRRAKWQDCCYRSA